MSTRCLRSHLRTPQIHVAVNSCCTKQLDDSSEVSSTQDDFISNISLYDENLKMPLNDTTNDLRFQSDVLNGSFKLPFNISNSSLRSSGRRFSSRKSRDVSLESLDVSSSSADFAVPTGRARRASSSLRRDPGWLNTPLNVSSCSINLPPVRTLRSSARSAEHSKCFPKNDDNNNDNARLDNVSSTTTNLPPVSTRRSFRLSGAHSRSFSENDDNATLNSAWNISSATINLPPVRARRSLSLSGSHSRNFSKNDSNTRLYSALNVSSATINFPPVQMRRSLRPSGGHSKSFSENYHDVATHRLDSAFNISSTSINLPPIGADSFSSQSCSISKTPITISNSSLSIFLRKRDDFKWDNYACVNELDLSFSSLASFNIDLPAQDSVPLHEIEISDLFFSGSTPKDVLPDVPDQGVESRYFPRVLLERLDLGCIHTSAHTTTSKPVPQRCQGDMGCQSLQRLDSTPTGCCSGEKTQPGKDGLADSSRVQCISCSRTYKHKVVLSRHITRKCGSKIRLHCPKCSKSYFQKKSLERHKLVLCGKPPQRYGNCSKCKRKVASKLDLQRHTQENCCFSCKICNKRFKYLRNLNSHMKPNSCRQALQCSDCFRHYRTKGDLEKHAQSCNKVPEHQCQKCGLRFQYKRGLTCHLRMRCLRPVVDPIEAKPTEAKPFKCVRCPKSYIRKGDLERHLQWECDKMRRFTCDLCGFKFKHKHHMKRHLKVIHSLGRTNK